MSELFTARWPILDQDQPISRLTVQAAAEVVVEEYNRRRKTKALPAWRSA